MQFCIINILLVGGKKRENTRLTVEGAVNKKKKKKTCWIRIYPDPK